MWEQKREATECQPQLLSYQFLASLLCENGTFLRVLGIRRCPVCLQMTILCSGSLKIAAVIVGWKAETLKDLHQCFISKTR